MSRDPTLQYGMRRKQICTVSGEGEDRERAIGSVAADTDVARLVNRDFEGKRYSDNNSDCMQPQCRVSSMRSAQVLILKCYLGAEREKADVALDGEEAWVCWAILHTYSRLCST